MATSKARKKSTARSLEKHPRQPAAGAPTGNERTRQNILDVATEEFATQGLSGARVDKIAARTLTSKRMIYYYFGGKHGLYRAVMERAYLGIRAEEMRHDLARLPPREALRKLVEITFDYDEGHVNFVRLVAIENVHRAKYISGLASIRGINQSVILAVGDILERGQKAGEFRHDVKALDIHLLISAFCFFRISNRHTVEALFDCRLSDARLRAKHRKMIVEAVLAYVGARADAAH